VMRPPAGYKAIYWQLEIEAWVDIYSVQVATSVKELNKAV